jgi:hypothetical protein
MICQLEIKLDNGNEMCTDDVDDKDADSAIT